MDIHVHVTTLSEHACARTHTHTQRNKYWSQENDAININVQNVLHHLSSNIKDLWIMIEKRRTIPGSVSSP